MTFDYKKECKKFYLPTDDQESRRTLKPVKRRRSCQGRREFLTSAELAPLLCMCLYSEIDPDGRLETGMPLTSTLSLS